MFNFTKKEKIDSKCYVTHGTLGHLDSKQPPTKRKPFSTLLNIPFVHKTELILPQELYELIQDDIEARFSGPRYSRVILPLSAIVEGEFFNEYIKRGNVIMLSEGRHGIDNVYSLRDGKLTLSLNKESYERAGLVGKPEGAKGSRGTRARWIVEINLRLPSMLHGKKGFDRIVYAFKNALTNPVTWLFSEPDTKESNVAPLAKHFPISLSCTPTISEAIDLIVPDLQSPPDAAASYDDDFRDFAADLYEWLALVSLQSPRVDVHDKIDPFLSRYTPPATSLSSPQTVVKMVWQGFMAAHVVHEIFVLVLAKTSSKMWFSVTASGFTESLPINGGDCTILKLEGVAREFLSWEVDLK